MHVVLSQPGDPIKAEITYGVRPGFEADQIPVSALVQAPARLTDLQAFLDGREMADDSSSFLQASREHFFEGSLPLHEEGGGGGTTHSLEITYRVDGAWTKEGRVTVPLVVPRWIPYEPSPSTFLAEVDVPAGFTVVGSFPTSVLRKPAPGTQGVFEVGLQAVPAMLVLRVKEGTGSWVTLERSLDAFVVLVLLAMGVVGLRYLRGKER